MLIRKILSNHVVAAAAILLLAVIAYSNSFPGKFLLDDVQMVKDNPLVSSIDMPTIFTTDYWGAESNTGLYRPLTVLSFSLNRMLLGAGPSDYHLVNLLLHAVVALLVFLSLQKWSVSSMVAWFAGALFAVHPLHTEVVNVVVGRNELLTALFLLLALYLARLPGLMASFGLLSCYSLALLSKEHAVVFLAVLPLLDWFFAEDSNWWRNRWRLYLGLLLVSIAWLLFRSWGITLISEPHPPDPYFTPLAFVDHPDRIVSALRLQILYLCKLIWPWPMQGIYADADHKAVVVSFGSLKGLLILAATAISLHAIIRGVLKRSVVALFALLYLISFSPTSNIFFAAGVTFAERLTYLPSVWFCAAVAVLLCKQKTKTPLGAPRRPVLVSAYVAVMLLMTLARNPDFASSIKLWEANVAVAPRNVLAWMYLASSYAEVDRDHAAEKAYAEMLRLSPEFPDGLRNYAGFLVDSGQPQKAISIAKRGVEAAQGTSPLSSLILAEAYYRVGSYDQALDALLKMESFYEHYWYFWALRGMIEEELGNEEEAIASYRQAQPWPEGSDLAQRMGTLLLKNQQVVEAERVLRQAAETTDTAEAWNLLGVALAIQKRNDEAAEAFKKAIEREPQKNNYRENLQRLNAAGR